jgi:hypothetical protein
MQPNCYQIPTFGMQLFYSCSYFQRLFYQKQLMQPNCQIPTFGMQLFYQKQLMQLFPTTFLSKTAHAAQLPNPHLRYAAFLSKTAHSYAISNDFSIKNSSCSYFQRLFYQKQLMQPNCQIPTFGMQLFYQKQLMQPNYHAAISNDFSIKNSSCSPTAKSPPSVCSFSIKNSSCSLIIMQLFPTTFLSKTAHAAQLPNPHLRYAAFLSKTAHAAISNDFSINQQKSPPSVCSFSIKNSSCNPRKKKEKITINTTFTSPPPTYLPTYLPTYQPQPQHHHLPTYLPTYLPTSAHPAPRTRTRHLLLLHTQLFIPL